INETRFGARGHLAGKLYAVTHAGGFRTNSAKSQLSDSVTPSLRQRLFLGRVKGYFRRERRCKSSHSPLGSQAQSFGWVAQMLQRICLVLSVCALGFFLGRGLSQAGWSGLGLTSAHDASSLLVSVKKKKHHDDDDDDDDDNGLEQCTIQSSGS